MLREKRHALILEHLKLVGAASIQDLARQIGVSGSTVRRDLKQLSERGYFELTHGGAVMAHGHLAGFEMESALAAQVAQNEKVAIGRLAAGELRPGQSVIFDSSTTVLEAARSAAGAGLPLTAITNSIEIARAFATSTMVEVVVVGGTVRAGSPTLTGEPGLGFLGEINADLALLGTHAISGLQLTETSKDVVAMKRAMIAAARRRLVLADGSKFQPPSLYRICEIARIDTIITDSGAEPAALERLRAAGVEVRQARVTA